MIDGRIIPIMKLWNSHFNEFIFRILVSYVLIVFVSYYSAKIRNVKVDSRFNNCLKIDLPKLYLSLMNLTIMSPLTKRVRLPT